LKARSKHKQELKITDVFVLRVLIQMTVVKVDAER